MSAKEIVDTDIKGPAVYKRDRDVEYTIFLPYTTISKSESRYKTALNYLFEAIYTVLNKYEFDTTDLRKEQNNIIEEILREPSMFDEEDDEEDLDFDDE